MRHINELRRDQDSFHMEDIRLSRSMTTQASLNQFLRSLNSIKWELQQAATLFEPDRMEALVELQTRLKRSFD